MAGNWQEAKLGDYVEIKHGFAFKSEFFCDSQTDNVLLTPGNFQIGGGFKDDKPKFYNGPVPEDYVLQANEIILTMTDLSKQADTLGYPALVPEKGNIKFLHNQRLGKVVFKSEQIVDSYLYYLLRSKPYRDEVLASASGTSIKHTAPKRIENFKFLMPPKSEQKAIGEVLSILDKKILANLQLCEALEKSAQSLFRNWFVDFDPVRAKTEGKKPEGLSDDLAALFPSKIDGGIPSGWREDSIYSCATFINGAAYKNMHFSDAEDALPVIKIAELKAGIGQGTKFTNTDLGGKYLIDSGDILFSWSGSPETSIDTFLWVGGKGWLNQHIFKVVTESAEMRTFTFFLLKHLKPIFVATAKDKQTTGLGHVTVQDLKRLKAVYPDQRVLKAFSEVATPHLGRIQKNMEQIADLNKIRDSLLPKLISGELRVSDAADFLNENKK